MENRVIKFRAWDEFPKYEIGDNGSVFSKSYKNTGKRKEMKQYFDDNGYLYVIMVNEGNRYKRVVHRMVAKCFIDNPNNKPQVNHKNGIRNDNRSENLEWCTSQENTIHGYKSNGRKHSEKQLQAARGMFGGVNNPKAKINEATVLSIRKLRASGNQLSDIADRYRISVAQVSAIANNKFWKEVTPELLNP